MESSVIDKGVNQISWIIAKTLFERRNSVLSPFSIGISYLYLASMSSNSTQEQFISNLEAKDFSKILKETRQILLSENKKKFKSLLFFISDQELKEDFYSLCEKWKCQVTKNPQEISRICSKEMKGKIDKPLRAFKLDQTCLLTVTHFSSHWMRKFSDVQEFPFKYNGRKQKYIPFLFEEINLLYLRKNAEMISLPYKNEYEALVIVPKEDPVDFLVNTEAKDIFKFYENASAQKIRVFIPEFEIESDFRLSDSFKEIGVMEAFQKETADFNKSFKTPHFISKVAHKAKIQFDKEGTETPPPRTVYHKKRYKTPPSKSTEFKADKPFIFMIVEPEKEIILFTCTVYSPN